MTIDLGILFSSPEKRDLIDSQSLIYRINYLIFSSSLSVFCFQKTITFCFDIEIYLSD